MPDTILTVSTPDGAMPTHLFTPAGEGPWPAVILYMDAFGVRPDLRAMAQRLADLGYCVALPDLYHRTGPLVPFDGATVMDDGPEKERFFAQIATVTVPNAMRDTQAVLDLLATQPGVAAGTVGTLGYCMGGRLALAAAGTHPDRVGAAASFHGARLATADPDSPHLLAREMRARVYVGIAAIDPGFSLVEAERLAAALRQGGVDHWIEIYDGVRHGFAVNGHVVYDQNASERHWEHLTRFFAESLPPFS